MDFSKDEPATNDTGVPKPEILRPVYTGDFCCDFSVDFWCDFKRDFAAISNRPCKLLAIQIAAESPVVYTGDLKSPWNRHEIAAKIAAKIASVNRP